MNIRTPYKSKHRDQILAVLRDREGSHMTAGQVLDQLREKGLTIGFSTVYRQLDRLVEEGAVNKYTVDAVAGACYEYKGEHGADPAFVHGKCEKCGKVVHLERRSVEAAMHSLGGAKEDEGFELDPVRTLFYGICGDGRRRD